MRPADLDLDRRLAEMCGAGTQQVVVEGDGDDRRLLVSVGGGAGGDLADRLTTAFERLRRLSSREALRERGVDLGFRLEDLLGLTVRHAPADDPAVALAWISRRTPREARLVAVEAPGPLALAAAFAARVGHAPARGAYAVGADGRVRVEAFELHVVEHCNLRCANCCNMSPLVADRVLPAEEVERLCREMAAALDVDVFKIMGGEPLLHPDIVGVLRAIRRSGVSAKVRLFTNGLLLHAMSDAFWESLDELTISNYASAPVRPHLLALARERARAHGFVLNVKDVSTFSQVLSEAFRGDEASVQTTFDRCWLRHRCLIVRGGRFYMCTRAAYAEDFLERVSCEAPPRGYALDRRGDGVPTSAPDLAQRLVAYMNRPQPLGACHYCLGGDGPVEAHHQLRKADVAAGRLSSLGVHGR